MIYITLNGEKFFLKKEVSIENFLTLNNIIKNNIVIEINKVIITKNLWGKKIIKNNDIIEIITAVGGG